MFEQLDYLYTPSRDVAADVEWFTRVSGGQLVFAIEAMGTRVAMVELTATRPRIVLAGHLDGDRPIHVYRVPDLAAAADELRSQGLGEGHALEIPMGPVHSYISPGGHRIAIYQLTRPDVLKGFIGRRDF
jgi:hypothetical protein